MIFFFPLSCVWSVRPVVLLSLTTSNIQTKRRPRRHPKIILTCTNANFQSEFFALGSLCVYDEKEKERGKDVCNSLLLLGADFQVVCNCVPSSSFLSFSARRLISTIKQGVFEKFGWFWWWAKGGLAQKTCQLFELFLSFFFV